MRGLFVVQLAETFAVLLDKAGLEWGFQAAHGRTAKAEELDLARRLGAKTKSGAAVVRVMPGSNEFIHLD